MSDTVGIKSVDKTFKVLECFTSKNPKLGVTEISEKLGLYKSNVHNILTTLEKLGYIEQDKSTSKYFLGKNFIKLSHVAMLATGHNSSVRQCIREISQEVNETVYYGLPDGKNIIYIDGAYPDPSYNTSVIIGVTAPLVCTGIGKAILAFSNQEYIDMVLQEPLIQYTDYTITDKQEFVDQLRLIRERGYSVDNMEHEYGVKCVGVPVFNRYNEVIAAVSATGPSLRFSEERIEIIYQCMKKKILILSDKL